MRGGQPGCLSCGFTSSCHAAALRSSEVDILTAVQSLVSDAYGNAQKLNVRDLGCARIRMNVE